MNTNLIKLDSVIDRVIRDNLKKVNNHSLHFCDLDEYDQETLLAYYLNTQEEPLFWLAESDNAAEVSSLLSAYLLNPTLDRRMDLLNEISKVALKENEHAIDELIDRRLALYEADILEERGYRSYRDSQTGEVLWA